MVVGCIPEWEDKILLCRRAIEPKYGLWTLPAGFMERGESAHEGAARETLEEADARVEVLDLYSLFSLPRIDHVYLLFRARLLDLGFGPGTESLEVRLFREDEIPWDDLAFPTVHWVLHAWRAVGEGFCLDALRAAAEAARTTGPFAARARAEILADLAGVQARLARRQLAGTATAGAQASETARLAREAAGVGDLVAIGVATRALTTLA
jgi:ADP-ribose pyrophosphatase YjhB (NUDIX family)